MVIFRASFDRKMKYYYLGLGVVFVVLSLIISGAPVFAAQCGGADTTLVECGNDEGGIWHILSLILDIMSIGIGILGVIGIMIAGIQYLTAGDKEDQAKKAKSRIYEIVLGLVVYAVLFVGLEWLLPGGIIRSESDLAKSGSTTQIEELEKQREAERAEIEELEDELDDDGDETSDSGSSGSKPKTNAEARKRLAKVANSLRKKKNRSKYRSAVKEAKTGKGNVCKNLGKSCGVYVSTVVRTALGIKKFPTTSDNIYKYVKKHPKSWKILSKNVKPQPGDILYEYGGGKFTNHISMYVKSGGKTKIAEASYPETPGGADCPNGSYPHVSGNQSSPPRYGRTGYKIFRYIGKKYKD